MDVLATDRCGNCGHEFADHIYVPDSITDYRCPVPEVLTSYGYFNGGDPREFHPDYPECSEEEIENHRRACELWNEAEAKGQTPEPEKCPSGWIQSEDGSTSIHVLNAPYGIGVCQCQFEQFFEHAEPGDEVELLDDE